jgi:8-amino-7-oxononanoate synthase
MRRETEGLQQHLAALDRSHRRRKLQRVTRHIADGCAVTVDGQRCLNFCSNDYLGLAQHPEVVAAFVQEATASGVGSGAAHLLGGHSHAHAALEEELAAFVKRERALLFSTGYMANLGIVASFAERGEVVVQDRLNHASLLDAARLSGARLIRYPHGDAQAAAGALQAHAATSLLATDGVFSMDGDVAPLAALATNCTDRGVWLLVDEAHALGVLGPDGRGSVAAVGLDATQVPLLMGTLGKALGCFGAFVAGDRAVIEWLMQRARTYLFTTATPPALAAASRAALRVSLAEPWRRQHLQTLIARFRESAHRSGLKPLDSHSPIQPLVIGGSDQALGLGDALRRRGFLVGVTRPPTVAEGSARLRVTLQATHSVDMVDALCVAIAEVRDSAAGQHGNG